MGMCKATRAGLGRRIDIRLIPYQSKGAAMLYFTGSGDFNKIMRAEALKKGFTINEYGIYKINDGKEDLIVLNNEKELYDILEEEYKLHYLLENVLSLVDFVKIIPVLILKFLISSFLAFILIATHPLSFSFSDSTVSLKLL